MTAEVRIYIGGVHASDRPTVIKTLLGSCVGVCLYDPVARAGGAVQDPLRFGVHAMA